MRFTFIRSPFCAFSAQGWAITGDLPPEKKAELELRYAKLDRAITEARSNVIMAEAQGQS